MSRPEHIRDLPDDRRTVEILSVNFDKLAVRPALSTKVTQFLAALEKESGAKLTANYAGLKVTVPATHDEMTTELLALQSNWDYRQKRYLAACGGSETLKNYERQDADAFAKEEGLPAIDDVIAKRYAEQQERLEEQLTEDSEPVTIVEQGSLKVVPE